MQSKWYSSVRQKYGLPLDNRHLYTKSDWQFFATAVTSKTVRGQIVRRIALWVNETVTGQMLTEFLTSMKKKANRLFSDRPMTDLYETEGDGGFAGSSFFARPVVGGHFTYLALDRACNGKATGGLAFLDEEQPSGEKVVAEVPKQRGEL